MDKYICGCCGGRINRSTMTCEYCGTQYKKENDDVIRIETFSNPVKTFSAKVAISDEFFKKFNMNTKEIYEVAIEELADQLSAALPLMMEIKQEYNPLNMERTLYGRIKIVQPVNGGKINGTD